MNKLKPGVNLLFDEREQKRRAMIDSIREDAMREYILQGIPLGVTDKAGKKIDLPVLTNLELYQIASKYLDMKDFAQRSFCMSFKERAENQPHGIVRLSELSNLAEYYDRNYPDAKVGQFIEKKVLRACSDIPYRDLVSLAKTIKSQKDYIKVCASYGIADNSLRSRKIRSYLEDLVRSVNGISVDGSIFENKKKLNTELRDDKVNEVIKQALRNSEKQLEYNMKVKRAIDEVNKEFIARKRFQVGDKVKSIANPVDVMLGDKPYGHTGVVIDVNVDPLEKFVIVRWDDGTETSQDKTSLELISKGAKRRGEKRVSLVDEDLSQYGIKELRDGLTLEDIEDRYPWILEADIKDAVIGEDSDGLVWYDGIWNNGIWRGDEGSLWANGIWKDGVWKNGWWLKGHWYNGTWEDGLWEGGYWHNGTWENGEWRDGQWIDGIWRRGIWKGGFDEDGHYHEEGDSPDKW